MSASKDTVKLPLPKTGVGSKPRLLSDEELVQLKKLSPLLSNEALADYFEMAECTFYNVLKRQPEVNAILKKGKAIINSDIQKKLFEKAREGNMTAICFYLKTQANWQEVKQVEVTTSQVGTSRTLIDVFNALHEVVDVEDIKDSEEDEEE